MSTNQEIKSLPLKKKYCATLVLVFRYHYHEISYSSLENFKLSDFRIIFIALVIAVSKNLTEVAQCKFSFFMVQIWFLI